jgi:hypothetical protein
MRSSAGDVLALERIFLGAQLTESPGTKGIAALWGRVRPSSQPTKPQVTVAKSNPNVVRLEKTDGGRYFPP